MSVADKNYVMDIHEATGNGAPTEKSVLAAIGGGVALSVYEQNEKLFKRAWADVTVHQGECNDADQADADAAFALRAAESHPGTRKTHLDALRKAKEKTAAARKAIRANPPKNPSLFTPLKEFVGEKMLRNRLKYKARNTVGIPQSDPDGKPFEDAANLGFWINQYEKSFWGQKALKARPLSPDAIEYRIAASVKSEADDISIKVDPTTGEIMWPRARVHGQRDSIDFAQVVFKLLEKDIVEAIMEKCVTVKDDGISESERRKLQAELDAQRDEALYQCEFWHRKTGGTFERKWAFDARHVLDIVQTTR